MEPSIDLKIYFKDLKFKNLKQIFLMELWNFMEFFFALEIIYSKLFSFEKLFAIKISFLRIKAFVEY